MAKFPILPPRPPVKKEKAFFPRLPIFFKGSIKNLSFPPIALISEATLPPKAFISEFPVPSAAGFTFLICSPLFPASSPSFFTSSEAFLELLESFSVSVAVFCASFPSFLTFSPEELALSAAFDKLSPNFSLLAEPVSAACDNSPKLFASELNFDIASSIPSTLTSIATTFPLSAIQHHPHFRVFRKSLIFFFL